MLNNALPPKKEVSSIIHFLKNGEYKNESQQFKKTSFFV